MTTVEAAVFRLQTENSVFRLRRTLLLLTTWATAAAAAACTCTAGQAPSCKPHCPCQTATDYCQGWDDPKAQTCDAAKNHTPSRCPVCTTGTPNCLTQEIYLTPGCNGTPNTTVNLPTDGHCHVYPGAILGGGPGSTPDNPVWVSTTSCDPSTKKLHGVGGGTSCNGNIVVGGNPTVETFDGSCSKHTIPVDGKNLSFYVKTSGTCAPIPLSPNAVCATGAPNCFTQKVYHEGQGCVGLPDATVNLPANGKCAVYPGAIAGAGPGSTTENPVWVSSVTCDPSTKTLHGIGGGSHCAGDAVVGGTPTTELFDGSCVKHTIPIAGMKDPLTFWVETTGDCVPPAPADGGLSTGVIVYIVVTCIAFLGFCAYMMIGAGERDDFAYQRDDFAYQRADDDGIYLPPRCVCSCVCVCVCVGGVG